MLVFSLVLFIMVNLTGRVMADGGHHEHHPPQLTGQTATSVSFLSDRVTVTFGPVNLPSGHDGELAASLPKHVFTVPDDMIMTGFHSSVFTKDGTPLPRQYLHHILMINIALPAPVNRYFSPGPAWRWRRPSFQRGME